VTVRRVVVLGTGAAGSAFAARLARAGAQVTLAGHWQAARDAVARDGIELHEGDAVSRIRVAAALATDSLGPADLVLVLVKAHQTAGVAGAAAKALAPDGLVLTLQNGLGNREALAAAVAPSRIALGVTLAGFTLLGPGRVQAFPGASILGTTPATAMGIARIAELFREARIETEITPDIASTLWSKLAINCAINPLAATLGVTNGALLASPETRETLTRAAREVAAVAAARGIHIDDPAALVLQVAADTGPNRSSMLQDLDRGAATEIDALNGAVLFEGARLGVPTPVNESLWRAVKQREKR
jgi:2-dehydropantoate 2-reductase